MAEPIGVRLTGKNWFHDGWIRGILGLPKAEFMDEDDPVTDIDEEAWREGYEMAQETPCSIREVFQKMIAIGQIRYS